MKLSIIIVNWNTKDLLKKCLKSIFDYGKNVDYEVIVVDNASADKSQELLSALQITNNKLQIILNNYNLGFAKAVNQGIAQTISNFSPPGRDPAKAGQFPISSYVLLLNPDIEIKKNTLEKMIEFMEENPRCGILGGKILNPDGTIQPSVRKFPDLLSQLFILLKLHRIFPSAPVLRKYLAVDFDYSKPQEVEQIMGAFFMIREKLIEEIGFFDENFFVWFEEVDFCKRVKKAGYKIYYYPETEIIHHGASSFSQVSPLKNQWQFNKSLLYYFKKHHSFWAYFILLILSPISLLLSLIISIFPWLRNFKKL